MRSLFLLAGLLLGAGLPASAPAADVPASDDLAVAFRDRVAPFLRQHCNTCHGGAKPKGDLDLSVFTTVDAVAADLPRWELVLEQLESGAMPPKAVKDRPDPAARAAVVAWVGGVRRREALRHAGDPGPVPARRLSNAEYDYSIRDLTGVDIRPTREFPVDPANEAGFDNSAESLTMSPALLKKYLEAARAVADHAVLAPDGLEFAPHPVRADTDRDKYCVRRIIDFYQRQPTDLADYLVAAWRHRHRAALGRSDATLEQAAAAARVSPRYLPHIWALLTEPAQPTGPVAALQRLWNDLPAPDGHDEAATLARVRKECGAIRDFAVELRTRLTPRIANLGGVRGLSAGSQPLVLWKNGQFAANRRRYVGNAGSIRPESLKAGTPEIRRLALPDDPSTCEADFRRFCDVVPDAFLVSERARVFLEGNEDKNNVGRLLSAGFHSMTGYYRDDAPLYDLILDDRGRAELDRLWREFETISDTPARQYSSFLWYERAESRFVSGPEFDFVRAEDRDATSDAKIEKLAAIYTAKARRNGANDAVMAAIDDFYTTIRVQLRRVEQTRKAAEPAHLRDLQALAERAYRRPLSDAERAGIVAFYRELRDRDGLAHDDAVRDTLVGVLMSPNFCYRVDLPGEGGGEGPGARGAGIRPLSAYDLASRLSYFLWSSLPDDELLARAASGDLTRPEVLAAQARRMLRDPRARALAVEFGGNWLDVRRFEEHNSVDRGRFPGFDDALRRAMFEEPIRFFLDVAARDASVHEFLEARHTFVNPVLAKHYGIPNIDGPADRWVRVDDADKYGRGGLLPMAVFLTKNAPGLRTSPVKRGYWVVRRLLGEHIPAPPPNVPELPADEAKLGERTLRETLARHRADVACAGCHERFDGIGLAFEGYGPIGERRERDLGGRPVDTRAAFPGGVEGDGLDGLRSYIEVKRRTEFDDNLCRKLLAYALGRTLLLSDDPTIDDLKARLAADGYRFGGLVEGIVASQQFRYKRFEAEAAE